MNPFTPHQQRHYDTVAKAIDYLCAHAPEQPNLAQLAAAVHQSEYHLQRLFSAWAGVSPKQFVQYLTKQRALQALQQADDVVNAALSTGLSGPGRLHDLMVNFEVMTPGEIRAKGRGLAISYGVGETPFGSALIGWTTRGICHLAFFDGKAQIALHELEQRWPAAARLENASQARLLLDQVFALATGEPPLRGNLKLLIRGTNFQIKVWEALLSTRPSEVLSYSHIAALALSPKAQRAVGSALAANSIAYLIPCHRVIRETGEVGQFRWGATRKRALLAWEAATRPQSIGKV